ncbi:DRTGG domain-containing protein [Tenuibacillus multivorans]|uniref:Predicted transcriptional regulator containing CBS domains n=1 Tax=Tenuibacillus multivorans TaxID=237069 RepID=A0A1G9ZU10_9BACI|nr:DRTGG domain-containing protein [Tenuibacillus multivorans]GEL76864.1 thioesterase [Tenuibacillus multivorans]SDN25132.1 Predicted transcriptional regulator containing CBS domains [Tenuibacillus multivorans]
MITKHEQILNHIEQLPIGTKISVRLIAKDMNVSEGTAYRAIKEAENMGYVSTIERVGTIRIERKKKENIEKLTFAEVVNIVDGQVLGGRSGLHKTLNKFVIGAMKLEAMMRYTEKGSLLIVGNRVKAQEQALNAGAAILITGGFDTTDHVKHLADQNELPVISCSYDTFTVAAMINRAIYDQLIKKEIIIIDDIYTPFEQTHLLREGDTIQQWYDLNNQTKHSRYPVINHQQRIIGMVTSKDIIGKPNHLKIEKVMTKNPISVQTTTSLAAAAHTMVWQGIELLPVVNDQNIFQGVITRQDVIKGLQSNQRQPQIGETIDDIVQKQLHYEVDSSWFTSEVTPQLTNHLGSLSYGVFASFVTEACNQVLKQQKTGDMVIENMSIYYMKPVQIGSHLTIIPQILEFGRKFAKVDVQIMSNDELAGKALVMTQFINR